MFKKMLARFGQGSTKVQLQLDQDAFVMGDDLTGQVVVHGGKVKQNINRVTVDFYLQLFHEGHHYQKLIHRFDVADSFSIQPDEEKIFPLQYQLPYQLLLSSETVTYHLIAHLDIQGGKDHSHQKTVLIQPHAPLQNVFAAFTQLGFEEKTSSRSFDGYLQEFAFAPTTLFQDKLEEIELNIVIKEDGLLLLMEFDCYSFLGEKEISRECWVEKTLLDDVEALANHLRQFIEETLQQHATYVGEKRYLQEKHYQLPGAIGAIAFGLIALELFDELVDDLEDELEEMMDEDDDAVDFFDDEDD